MSAWTSFTSLYRMLTVLVVALLFTRKFVINNATNPIRAKAIRISDKLKPWALRGFKIWVLCLIRSLRAPLQNLYGIHKYVGIIGAGILGNGNIQRPIRNIHIIHFNVS